MYKRTILMIGPNTGKSNGGGIASYIKSIIPILKKENDIVRIKTMSDLNIFKRISDFSISILQVLFFSINKKNKVAHIHMASRWSYKRKSILIKILKWRKIPIILHLHGGEFHLFFEKESSKEMKEKIIKTFMLCDEIITLSNSWAKWVKKHIKHPSINMIYNGANSYLNVDDLVSKRENIILFMGRIGERKGIYDLLESLVLLNNEYNDFKLLIAGDGEIEKAKHAVKEKGLENQVTFLGWVGEKDKLELLSKAKIFLLPSYNEGLPIGILEAMSAKVPVVSTYVGGIPETIIENETGLLFEAGDIKSLKNHILNVLTNTELCEKLSLNSRDRYLKYFSLENVCNELNRLYKKLGK